MQIIFWTATRFKSQWLLSVTQNLQRLPSATIPSTVATISDTTTTSTHHEYHCCIRLLQPIPIHNATTTTFVYSKTKCDCRCGHCISVKQNAIVSIFKQHSNLAAFYCITYQYCVCTCQITAGVKFHCQAKNLQPQPAVQLTADVNFHFQAKNLQHLLAVHVTSETLALLLDLPKFYLVFKMD